MAPTTLSDVLTILVQGPKFNSFSVDAQLLNSLTVHAQYACSTGLIGQYCNSFTGDAPEVNNSTVLALHAHYPRQFCSK